MKLFDKVFKAILRDEVKAMIKLYKIKKLGLALDLSQEVWEGSLENGKKGISDFWTYSSRFGLEGCSLCVVEL